MNEKTLGRIFHVSLEGRGVEENASYLKKLRPGTISVYSNDFIGVDELRELIRGIERFYKTELGLEKPLIAIDQEGGRVMRIGELQGPPGNMAIGAAGDAKLSEYSGAVLGEELVGLGVDWDLAPVLDVNDNAHNPIIGTRSFGDDVESVSNLGAGFIRGMKSTGCLTAAKHFPGHGSVHIDSHIDLPVDNRSADSIKKEAMPFAAALRSGVDSVMVSHLSYPSITGEEDMPATFSREIITTYLKEELSCGVPVMTDSMSMGAIKKHYPPAEGAVKAIEAGMDMIALTDMEDAVEMFEALLAKKSALESRLKDAMDRVSSLRGASRQRRGEPREIMSHLVYSSICRLGPDNRPDRPFESRWALYDFEVTVAGRSYSPLREALKKLGVGFDIAGEEGPALVQMSDEHITHHHDLAKIREGHEEVYAIGVSTPYDASLIPGVPYYTGFSPDIRSVVACVESLFGLFEPRGRCPVRLPDMDRNKGAGQTA